MTAQHKFPRKGVEEINSQPDNNHIQETPACFLNIGQNLVNPELVDEKNKNSKAEKEKKGFGSLEFHEYQNTENFT